jgi:hypothetical protein
MKYYLLPVLSFLFIQSAKAVDKDSTVYYNLPDSIKAVQFMAEITITGSDKKRFSAGIKTDTVGLYMERFPFGGRISFSCPSSLNFVAAGEGVRYDRKFGDMGWSYDWKLDETYKLLIAQATDSAGNFSLYSGYIFLPRENKWKFIGTCKIQGRWNTIKQPAGIYYSRKNSTQASYGQVWIQRSNGSWKNMKENNQPSPVINSFGHIDSVQQHQTDIKLIEDAITSGKIDTRNNEQGLYYTMIKKGSGRQVSINDTVTVFYKLTLLNDGSLVTETKAKPDTFSLKRLIRGWQIGVPLCKVGGKIKLVIPSDLAYSIRTRSAKIPPNSILVFEIEVLDAKSPL